MNPASRPTSLRSALFVPGDRPERFDKAWATHADDIVIDLEDAVDPINKSGARKSIESWLSAARPVVVRVNAQETSWHAEDIELLRHEGVRALMLPKAEHIDPAIGSLCATCNKLLLPIIETAKGIDQAAVLARAPNVERLVFGTLDFQVDTGIAGEDDALAYFRSRIVLASVLARIGSPLDGVTTAIDDEQLLRADTLRAKRFGFGGKLCIHPKQVDRVNELFTPTDVEAAWATRVLEAIAQSRGAAVTVDGKMVDRPVILKAEAILDASDRPHRWAG